MWKDEEEYDPPHHLPQVPLSPAGVPLKAGQHGRRGAIAASRGRDRFAPDSPHRQAVWPISTGRRRGRVFSLVSGALPESGATRDAREARKEQHFRVRSRLSISGGSVCAAREGRRLHLNRERTLWASLSRAGCLRWSGFGSRSGDPTTNLPAGVYGPNHNTSNLPSLLGAARRLSETD